MLKQNSVLNYAYAEKIVFALSLLVCVFWYTGQHTNVYSYAVVGAIFEFLAIPMLLLLVLLPVICLFIIIKKRVSIKTLSLYSLVLLLATLLLLAIS